MRPIPTALTNAELRVLSDLAQDAGGPLLELGAQFGASTVMLARACAYKVHSVDWHLGDANAGELDTLWPFLINLELAHVRERVVVHVGRFADVLPLFREGQFAGAFINGAHDYGSVLADVAAARGLLIPSGWIAIHDYGRFDVERAVKASELEEVDLIDTLYVGRAA